MSLVFVFRFCKTNQNRLGFFQSPSRYSTKHFFHHVCTSSCPWYGLAVVYCVPSNLLLSKWGDQTRAVLHLFMWTLTFPGKKVFAYKIYNVCWSSFERDNFLRTKISPLIIIKSPDFFFVIGSVLTSFPPLTFAVLYLFVWFQILYWPILSEFSNAYILWYSSEYSLVLPVCNKEGYNSHPTCFWFF